MAFDEGRSQVRTASGPHITASLRNLVITIWRLAGAASITAALRYHARRPSRPLRTIMNSSTTCRSREGEVEQFQAADGLEAGCRVKPERGAVIGLGLH